MKRAFFLTIRASFVLVVISAMLSLAMYSSRFSPKNSLSRTQVDFSLQFTEEEEERTVREVPEADLYMDYVATAILNDKLRAVDFPLYLNLSPQEYPTLLRKPPRLS